MCIVEDIPQKEQPKISDENAKVLGNFFRCFTMLEKTLERLARQRWYSKDQYPEIYFEILSALCLIRTWAEDYRIYSDFQLFQDSLAIFITGIADQVFTLIETSHHSPGKKKETKTRRQKQQARIQRSIKEMLDNLVKHSGKLEECDTPVSHAIKMALAESFEKSCLKAHEQRHRKIKANLPKRGEKSFVFPWL